jgi:hydrogenase-4 component B
VLLAALAVGTALLQWRIRAEQVAYAGTWDCGYAAPTARMQYTGSSFSQWLVELFGWVLRPKTDRPRLTALFPQSAEFRSHVPDLVLDKAVMPAFRFMAGLLFWFRILQQGNLHAYLLYIFGILIALMLYFR